MERNTERKVLSFGKGMTNVPSDMMSEDNELEVCDGFIYRDGEMKPVRKPVKIGNTSFTIMYVHKMADYKCLITKVDHNSTSIVCYKMTDEGIDINSGQTFDVGGELLDVKSVGNTLVCATENGIHYLLYKNSEYIDLGTELPKPVVAFSLSSTEPINADTPIKYESFVNHKTLKVSYDGDGNVCKIHKLLYINNRGDFGEHAVTINNNEPVKEEAYEAYAVTNDNDNNENVFQDAVTGHVSSIINKAKEKNLFCFPFFVRYALRLFDGTYARISNPVICYPSITGNHFSRVSSEIAEFTLYGVYLKASISIPQKEKWRDIVKEIVFFATKGVMPFKLEKGWKFGYPDEVYGMTWFDSVSGDDYHEDKYSRHSGSTDEPCMRIIPSLKTKDKIKEELKNNAVFYKIAQIDVMSEVIDGTDKVLHIDEGVLPNLETQEQLKKDDYYGWAYYAFKKMYPYNGRLNVAGACRIPFEGFSSFCALDDVTTGVNSYEYYVHIESATMSRWVKSEKGKAPICTLNGWFFYPDINATEVLIYDTKNFRRISSKLQPHPLLNGSYKIDLPNNTVSWENADYYPDIEESKKEDLNTQVFTSVVNNPFVFEASGDNTVGTGKILGIIANTEAISQGQFGQYPLMVFTTEGIYAMSVTSEGIYGSIHPISREVCLENSPLVPTDRLVYFASKKGLMAASGAEAAAMSEQMKGKPIMEDGGLASYLESALIAYDYRDSLLRIYSKVHPWQYIYNMKDKTFSVVEDGVKAKAVVNDYPDNLIQDTDGNVYSLTAKPDINDDSNVYNGSFTTRALKLGGSITLKSLRAIKHLMDVSDNGKVKLEVWGSNNAKHWIKLSSLGGKPWTYFKMRYTLTGFKATDSYAGTLVEVQKRREDKMR